MLLLNMAKREKPNQIPKKFRKFRKSFLDPLQKRNNSFFNSFPRDLTFQGKEKDENVVLVVRSHWIVYLPFLFVAIVILLLPLVFEIVLSSFSENMVLFLALFVSCLTVSLTIIMYSFVRWFYDVNIITDRRVIDLDFTSVVSHSFSEARLTRIEDVTHKQKGIIGSIFDIGTVYFQTAGATARIEFDSIPRPRDVQNIMYNLLESKKRGEI
jgi:membrane protein YdbS with pleckstrin-like domain